MSAAHRPKRPGWFRQPLLGLWMVVLWVLLWGDVSTANVLSGLAVAGVVLWALPVGGREAGLRIRPVRAVGYLGFFLYQLVKANLLMAWEIITPRNKIRTGVVAVPVLGCSDALVTLVANSISLTPGTLVLEVRREPVTLYIHVLHLRDPNEIRDEVLRLERLAIRAFGTDEALAALDAATEVST